MQNKIISILFLLLVVINANAQKKVDTNTSIEQQGMVDIHSLDKTIRVSLMYSRITSQVRCFIPTLQRLIFTLLQPMRW